MTFFISDANEKDAILQPTGSNTRSGFSLSTTAEYVDEEVTVTFTNSKNKRENVVLRKVLENASESNLDVFGFTVELTVDEESFPEESSRWLVPKSFLPKNPRVVNTGTTDAYVFVEIVVPYDEALLIIDEGEAINTPDPAGVKAQELFNIISDDENAVSGDDTDGFYSGFTVTAAGSFSYQHDWIFLSSHEDTGNKTHSYLFGYRSLLTTDEEHNKTTEIFDRIQLRNILEGSFSQDPEKSINVNVYGIQSDELRGSITIEDPTDVTKAELESLYTYYCNQEG